MRRRLFAGIAGLGVLGLPSSAWAIDAAHSLRPAAYPPSNVKKAEAEAAMAGQKPRAAKRAKAPAPPPGSIDFNTASGKPFVGVASTDCKVLAGADLAAQLAACAGINRTAAGTRSAQRR